MNGQTTPNVIQADQEAALSVGAITEERTHIIAEAFARHREGAEAAAKEREAELVEVLDALMANNGSRGTYDAGKYLRAKERAEAILAKRGETA